MSGLLRRQPHDPLAQRISGQELTESLLEQQPQAQIVQVEVAAPVLYDAEHQVAWIGNFGVSQFGLYIHEANHKEWHDFVSAVNTIESAGDWIKADWCRYGADDLEINYDEIGRLIGMTAESAEVYASISRSADELIRINSPSFTHFRKVSGLPRDQQLQWLQRAKVEKWSAAHLADEIERTVNIITPDGDAFDLSSKRKEFAQMMKKIGLAAQGNVKARRESLGWIAEQRQWLDEVEQWLKNSL